MVNHAEEAVLRDLDSFLPDRIYDTHAHLFRAQFWPAGSPYSIADMPADITLEAYREQVGRILPNREIHGLHFPLAFVADTGPGNSWVAQEIAKDDQARGQFLVRPTDDPEWVRQEVKRLGLRGLKPFATYAQVANTWEAEIPDYLPERLAAVANQEGWSVTLHMMRYDGVADASNQHWIKRYCQTYPDLQLILDHCARGFNPYQVLRGLGELSHLDNLWVDTSVVCNPFSVEAALRIMGAKKVLYGSDFCLTHLRGINLGVADTFLWLYEDTPIWDTAGHTPRVEPLLIGIENLRAIKAACWSLGLGDAQIEDIFWGNAAQLLGV